MAEILVSASTGVIDSLLRKLGTIMGEEYTKLKGLRKQAQFLHDELSSMGALLEDLADKEGLDNQTKQWRNKVTEISYDIEDCLDDFMHRVGAPHEGKGLMHLLETLRARHQLANQIQELKERVQEASAGHMRYKLDECMSRSANVFIDPRITALYAETSSLVGINGPKEEVIKLLIKVEEDASMQELRVVSIVGFGGLGKTTLANEVYRKLGRDFDFKAFIPVSQRPDVMSLLKFLLSKVAEKDIACNCELPDIEDNIKMHLQGKRYLIVVDDLWETSPWEIIKCAFPEDHCGSRVLTTTRINSVAVTCCNYQQQFVYMMKPLDYHNSRQLFFRRLFGTENTCPQQLQELSDKILQRCGGMPLAIISIASLLACQPTTSIDQWKYILDSLCHDLGSNPALKGVMNILNLSYTHLPRHLKTCLLYTGMYPEDHDINKNDLVMQWIAEGFVSEVGGRDPIEVAGSYFNELVNRSLILQLSDDTPWKSIHYKVHDMVLELILSRSTEENFMCVSHNPRRITAGLQGKARRLSLQLDGISLDRSSASVSLPHIRSLFMIGSSFLSLQALKLKFLRVLSIYDIDCYAEGFDLTSLGNLFLLRYLKIYCYSSAEQVELPRQMCRLQQLEVLSVRGRLSVLPTDLVDLPALSLLELEDGIAYPSGISKMRSLHF